MPDNMTRRVLTVRNTGIIAEPTVTQAQVSREDGLFVVRGAAGLTSGGSRGGGCGNKGINEKELNHFFTLTFQDVFGRYSMLP